MPSKVMNPSSRDVLRNEMRNMGIKMRTVSQDVQRLESEKRKIEIEIAMAKLQAELNRLQEVQNAS